MNTKSEIVAEIDRLDESELAELLVLLRQLTKRRHTTRKSGFLSGLREIEIEAPEDYSTNFDREVIGESGDR